MANEPVTTIIGNLTADPELRFTPAGAAVANFTLASTPRNFNRTSNQFEDGETLFMKCNLWREYAENFVESLNKGDSVIATGQLKSRSFETKEGEKRTVIEFEVLEAGPALRYSTAKPVKTQRSAPGGGQQGAPQGQQGGYQQRPQGQQQGGYQQQGAPQGGYPAQGGYQQPPQGAPQGQPMGQPVQGQNVDAWGAPQGQQPGYQQPQQGQQPNYASEI